MPRAQARMPARMTIRDVAEQAGVSVATVSKVLNNRYGVAAATQERVQEVIDSLGYETSLVARSLRNQTTNVIGILVADLEPFSTELLKGASRAIRGTGYELVVYSAGGVSNDHVGWERRYLSRLAGTLIDGAVLVTPTVVDAPSGVPVVAVDPHTGTPGPPTVDSDNLNGARLAVDHLLALGHRRIGFLAGRPDLESARLREVGYRQAISAAGLTVDPDLIRVGSYELEGSEGAARELLTMEDRPTAIFAANDLMALETLVVAGELGLRVPHDLSIVGFDNIPETVMSNPPLTTINQPIQEMGGRSIEMLIQLMDAADESPDLHVTLPTQLVVRQSTAVPPH
jgi:LacI family transcriptional regulator